MPNTSKHFAQKTNTLKWRSLSSTFRAIQHFPFKEFLPFAPSSIFSMKYQALWPESQHFEMSQHLCEEKQLHCLIFKGCYFPKAWFSRFPKTSMEPITYMQYMWTGITPFTMELLGCLLHVVLSSNCREAGKWDCTWLHNITAGVRPSLQRLKSWRYLPEDLGRRDYLQPATGDIEVWYWSWNAYDHNTSTKLEPSPGSPARNSPFHHFHPFPFNQGDTSYLWSAQANSVSQIFLPNLARDWAKNSGIISLGTCVTCLTCDHTILKCFTFSTGTVWKGTYDSIDRLWQCKLQVPDVVNFANQELLVVLHQILQSRKTAPVAVDGHSVDAAALASLQEPGAQRLSTESTGHGTELKCVASTCFMLQLWCWMLIGLPTGIHWFTHWFTPFLWDLEEFDIGTGYVGTWNFRDRRRALPSTKCPCQCLRTSLGLTEVMVILAINEGCKSSSVEELPS